MTPLDGAGPSAPVAAASRQTHPYRDVFVQLVTIVAGVLIALFFDGLVAWNQDRQLVNEARTMIRREIADNRKALDTLVQSADDRGKDVQNALLLANELLRTGKSDVREFRLVRPIAELSASSWQTAERTGALGHMEYEEVHRYSTLYAIQEVLAIHERRFLDRLGAVMAIAAEGDPHKASPEDLRAFRGHLQAIYGDLIIEQDLARKLRTAYDAELKR